jgi:hypothetical protein
VGKDLISHLIIQEIQEIQESREFRAKEKTRQILAGFQLLRRC